MERDKRAKGDPKDGDEKAAGGEKQVMQPVSIHRL